MLDFSLEEMPWLVHQGDKDAFPPWDQILCYCCTMPGMFPWAVHQAGIKVLIPLTSCVLA